MLDTTQFVGDGTQARLGPFVVDGAGLLHLADHASPNVSVCWRDRLVHASFAAAPGIRDIGRLSFRVLVGWVPSSAAGLASAAPRAPLFEALRALPPLLPPEWRVALLPDHQVCLAAETTVALPMSAFSLITALVAFLWTAAPYLELLAEYGCTPPASMPARGPQRGHRAPASASASPA